MLQVECDRLADEVDQWSDRQGIYFLSCCRVTKLANNSQQITHTFSTIGGDERGFLPGHLYQSVVVKETAAESATAALADSTTGVAAGAADNGCE